MCLAYLLVHHRLRLSLRLAARLLLVWVFRLARQARLGPLEPLEVPEPLHQ
tara:strand:- start:232 stop:384 length:153 start_codon:yes stop_codon:yes gene_type:complete